MLVVRAASERVACTGFAGTYADGALHSAGDEPALVLAKGPCRGRICRAILREAFSLRSSYYSDCQSCDSAEFGCKPENADTRTTMWFERGAHHRVDGPAIVSGGYWVMCYRGQPACPPGIRRRLPHGSICLPDLAEYYSPKIKSRLLRKTPVAAVYSVSAELMALFIPDAFGGLAAVIDNDTGEFLRCKASKTGTRVVVDM